MAFYRVIEAFIEVVATGQAPDVISVALRSPDLDATVAHIRSCGGPISNPKPRGSGRANRLGGNGHLDWGSGHHGAVSHRRTSEVDTGQEDTGQVSHGVSTHPNRREFLAIANALTGARLLSATACTAKGLPKRWATESGDHQAHVLVETVVPIAQA